MRVTAAARREAARISYLGGVAAGSYSPPPPPRRPRPWDQWAAEKRIDPHRKLVGKLRGRGGFLSPTRRRIEVERRSSRRH